ncbi:MAG: 2-oxo-4-hydroxy-4-carboxy-5-ureidoimidazoline decarboxylase [Alphaproteobacteria bacterium]
MDRDAFVAALGDVVEASPWVAEEAANHRPLRSRAALHRAFCDALDGADKGAQLAVLRAHPDLGAELDDLGEASRDEQRKAGLDQLTPAQRAQLRELNDAYRVKFGFPFIVAVQGADHGRVLAAFEARLPNDLDTEFAAALGEVETIVANRLDDRVDEA